MKLDNIIEQLTNDDVKKILKSYDYTSSFFASIKAKRISVTLEQNLYISYKNADECVLPFDISDGEVVKYFACTLDKRFTQPLKCDAFKIDECDFMTEDIVITTDTQEYNLHSCRNGTRLLIENHESSVAHGGTKITIADLEISKVSIKLPAAKFKNVAISNCQNIKTFSDIVCNDSISNYEIRNIGVKSFKGFDTLVTNLLMVRSAFDNYLFTDELNVHRFDLNLYSHCDNIITLLMNKHCETIMLYCGTPGINDDVIRDSIKRVIRIMHHYLHEHDKNSRSDYVMDCAVELIDAGFPEAAEL